MPNENAIPAADRGVYGISVAAGLAGMDPQSLRLYERRGLLEPDRTPGGTRLYSADDVDRLRRIGALLAAGVNLTGVGMVMDLQDTNGRLSSDNDALRSALQEPGTGRN
jgi:DNA-binding transcriptional MerR regulator